MQPLLPSDRKFGFVFTVVFTLVAAKLIWRGHTAHALPALILAVSTGLAAVLRPQLLRPLNKAWFNLGLLMGKIVSPIVLGAIFFLIITPVALVARCFGRDPLRLKGSAESYWIARSRLESAASESFKNQF